MGLEGERVAEPFRHITRRHTDPGRSLEEGERKASVPVEHPLMIGPKTRSLADIAAEDAARVRGHGLSARRQDHNDHDNERGDPVRAAGPTTSSSDRIRRVPGSIDGGHGLVARRHGSPL
jgi:hypothetical protein